MPLNLTDQVLNRRVFNDQVNQRLRDTTILKVLPEFLDETKIAIDVGAATGHITNAIAPHVHSVYGIEAVHPVFRQYCLMQDRHPNVYPIFGAASETNGITSFYVDANRLSNSSINKLVEGPETRVPMLSLDTFFFGHRPEPGFIKVDVEGTELRVLKGAQAIIEKHRPVLMIEVYRPYIEVDPLDLFHWIMDRGYRCLYWDCVQKGLVEVSDPQDGVIAIDTAHDRHDGDFLFIPEG
jgi:FkbM family methyltransferase